MAVAERSGAEEGEEEASASLKASEPEAEDAEPEAEGAGRQRKKLPVPGVVYLSHVPPGFGPRQLRALLGGHGELGRVFLQPCGGAVRRRGRKGAGRYAEGWVEFRDKRAARRAASHLQGAPISNRPRSRFRYDRWCLKYLPGFRWPHLSERLAAERQARAHRLRAEAAQAKREGGFYRRCAAMAAPPQLQDPPQNDPQAPDEPQPDGRPTWGFAQRPTEPEIWGRKKKPPRPPARQLLAKVFAGGR
ncbi:activator of basal transcription 1 [Numida meleagris]|uniref:activator of basal transcription 1 n=1 Tax=Numida meleagris TaxID=8996 RepID=UPI000B3D850E|nr:activator of basal transcription 1 [Numida meleagris]